MIIVLYTVFRDSYVLGALFIFLSPLLSPFPSVSLSLFSCYSILYSTTTTGIILACSPTKLCSPMPFMQSKMKNCAVQNHKVKDPSVKYRESLQPCRPLSSLSGYFSLNALFVLYLAEPETRRYLSVSLKN